MTGFTTAEREAPVFRKLMTHAQAKLDELRRKNDNDLDPIRTARTRGQIEVYKSILRLDDPLPQTIPADDD